MKKDIRKGYESRSRRQLLATIVLVAAVIALAVVAMVYGNTIYSLNTVIRVVLGEDVQGAVFTIRTLRLPRMLTGILAGLAFGMAGYTFQKLLGNPLASPDIIGITSGASVVAVFAILVLHLSGMVVSIMAVAGGLFIAFLIYTLAQGEGFFNGRLILTGIGVQAFLNSVISWILLKASEYDVASALRWLSGSLNGVALTEVPLLAVVVFLAGSVIMLYSRHLEVMQLGEEFSQTLGVQTKKVRLLMICAALFLTAFATAVTGPIASVAFLAGPIAVRIVGQGRNALLPAGLVGAVLVLASDLIGQYAFTTRYPVGVITGILGAPYLLFLLVNMNHKGENV